MVATHLALGGAAVAEAMLTACAVNQLFDWFKSISLAVSSTCAASAGATLQGADFERGVSSSKQSSEFLNFWCGLQFLVAKPHVAANSSHVTVNLTLRASG